MSRPQRPSHQQNQQPAQHLHKFNSLTDTQTPIQILYAFSAHSYKITEPYQAILRLQIGFHDPELNRQWFVIALQAVVGGKVIARETISALRKDVTGYLYGGDITRKMKLREKQKKGKKKMLCRGKVNIPEEVFLKMVKNG